MVFKQLKQALGRKDSPARYRIYLCAGPNCCTPEEGRAAWEALKRQVKAQELDAGDRRVEITKSECMNVCGEGPVAVVYPDAVWYSKMNGERIVRTLEEHCGGDRPVEEFTFEPPDDAREPFEERNRRSPASTD